MIKKSLAFACTPGEIGNTADITVEEALELIALCERLGNAHAANVTDTELVIENRRVCKTYFSGPKEEIAVLIKAMRFQTPAQWEEREKAAADEHARLTAAAVAARVEGSSAAAH